MSQSNLLNLPNILTLSRLAAIPVVVLLLQFESKTTCLVGRGYLYPGSHYRLA